VIRRVVLATVESVGVVEFHALSGEVYQAAGCAEVRETSDVASCSFCGTLRADTSGRCPECGAPPEG